MKIDLPFDSHYLKSYRIANEALRGDISVVEIGYHRTTPALKQASQRNVYILHYIVGGKGTFQNTAFDENCGYIVVPEEWEIVESDQKDPYETYWIMFQGPSSTDFLKKSALPMHNSVFSFRKTKESAAILKSALFESQPQNSFEEACLMQAAFYRIMALHMQDSETHTPSTCNIAKKVMQLIQEHYQQPLKIEDIAKEYNYTRNYLYSLFKKEYKVSPQEYLISVRIKKAQQLLSDKTKSLSICEVAFAVGFRDPLYFSRLFHKKVGVSPTVYRKQFNRLSEDSGN